MAQNLILATSFGFKLNSNLKITHELVDKSSLIPILVLWTVSRSIVRPEWPC